MPVSTRARPLPSSFSEMRNAVSVVVRITVAERRASAAARSAAPSSPAPSAASSTSLSPGRRGVMRMPLGKRRTIRPRASSSSAFAAAAASGTKMKLANDSGQS